jgi:hypothetical protein
MKTRLLLARVTFPLYVICLLISPTNTVAQKTLSPTERYLFEYATKFLCVTNIPGTSQSTTAVLPGAYLTVINIHNPNDETVSFRQKIASEKPKFVEERLGPDQSTGVDCSRLTKDFGIQFIHGAEGFFVIESPLSLDVIAVYTAGKRADDGVDSMAVERVQERRISELRNK